MVKWNVESRCGSRANPPRCRVSLSYSPQGRRSRHDDSTSNDRPRRRLHHKPECPRAWVNPADGFCEWHRQRAGTRPGRRFGRGLRPVGPVAPALSGGHRGLPGAGQAHPARVGPVRPCPGLGPDGCLYPPGHAAGPARASGRARHRFELVSPAARRPPGARRAHPRTPAGPPDQGGRRPAAGPTVQTPLPHDRPADRYVGLNTARSTSGRGDER